MFAIGAFGEKSISVSNADALYGNHRTLRMVDNIAAGFLDSETPIVSSSQPRVPYVERTRGAMAYSE